MKKLLLTISLLSIGTAAIPQQQQPVNCQCGQHSTGITYYTVSPGQECCSGTPGPTGAITYYV